MVYQLPVKEPEIWLYNYTAVEMPSVRITFKGSIDSTFCVEIVCEC